ncbi:MAG: transglutaminase family protein [Phenylobacterium sp.]|nr:transglutaminase family protein [Phenylobacterium sp.]
MPRLSLVHRTTYRYRNPVALGEHRVMARPMETFDQRVLSADLEISPDPSRFRTIHDLSNAAVTIAHFDGRTDRLDFDLRAELEHWPERAASAQDDDAPLGEDGVAYAPADAAALAPFLDATPGAADTVIDDWARRFVKPVGRTRIATALSDMTHAIRDEFTYELRVTGKPQSAAETLDRGRGSCRDFAVLLMTTARRLGVATQFVSGYVYSPFAGSAPVGGGHTHAWARAYLPDVGWCDFDPTNGIVGSQGLIRVAAVAHARDAVPLHGTWSGFASDFLSLDVEVAVRSHDEVATQPIASKGISQRRN